MKRSTKYILAGAGLFVVMVVGVIGYGLYSIYSTLRSFGLGRDIPETLKEARVTTGAEFLRRSEFFKLEHSGWLKTISEGSKVADQKERERLLNARTAAGIFNFADLRVVGDEIIAAAEFGAFVFDHHGNLKSQAGFEPATERVKIGPIETDTNVSNMDNLRIVRLDQQRTGFLAFSLTNGVRVFDSKGTEIWSFGKETIDLGVLVSGDSEERFEKSSWVLEAAVGDLDGDGVSEYIVARKRDGIRVYDQTGRERWFHANEYPSGRLEVADLNGDGKGELLAMGIGIFDSTGRMIRALKSGGDAHVLKETKERNFEVSFADLYEGKLTYTSENREKVFSADAPLSEVKIPSRRVDVPGAPEMSYTDDAERVAFPKAVLVSLRKGEPKYLAVVVSFIGLPRSNFYVYDQKGKLVYHELLAEDAEAIATMPAVDGVESILIGGKDTIWKYTVN